MKQSSLFKNESKEYGGDLLKKRSARSRPRPLDTRKSMHLILRSTKAKGEWSFRNRRNSKIIHRVITRFADKYGVKLLSLANVGNHLHFHLRLSNRRAYAPFIRAITSGIAMAVTGASRWKPLKHKASDRFWDRRPYTRVLVSLRELFNLEDYIRINQLEGEGFSREQARTIAEGEKRFRRCLS